MKIKNRIEIICLMLNIVLIAYLCVGSVVALDGFSAIDEQEQVIESAQLLEEVDANSSSIGDCECDFGFKEELQPIMAAASTGENVSPVWYALSHGKTANFTGSYTLPANTPTPGGGGLPGNNSWAYPITFFFSSGKVSSWTHHSDHGGGHSNPHNHTFGWQSNGWWGPNAPCNY